MDLGISGHKAIVCASSKGLGKACALALAREGADVWISARTESTLQEAAAEINAACGGRATAVVADVTSPDGREALLAACPNPDILVNNAGGPPPGNFRDWEQQDWFDAVNSNMFSAIDLIRRCLDGMIERDFGRIINITSVAVKLPQGELGLSNGARAGLTGFVAGLARDPANRQVTINNLMPGFIATDRMWNVLRAKAEAAGVEMEQLSEQFFSRLPSARPGDPDEFGAVCAFLSSRQAAYINGQNILMDGGLYPGTF